MTFRSSESSKHGPHELRGRTFLVLLDTRRFTVQNFLLNTFFPDDQLAVG
jgi:hypothetical protein